MLLERVAIIESQAQEAGFEPASYEIELMISG
jgi:hypothetical protein